MKTTVKVYGDKALQTKLRKISYGALSAKHDIALRAAAEIIRTAAVRNVHSKLNKKTSGNLARSIKVELR